MITLKQFLQRTASGTVFVILAAMMVVSGCSVLIGKEDGADSRVPLNLTFVETLRNQESLRGESFRDPVYGTNPATSLQRPNSVYADQFRVYVTDNITPGRVFLFDRGDRTAVILNTPQPASSGDGKLLAPSGIAVDSAGSILISDSQQGRVFGYDRKGALVLVLGRGGTIPSQGGLGDLSTPSGLAIDPVRNRIYVSDSSAQQVKVFTTLGMHLFDIGRSGKADRDFKFPVSVALDRSGTLHVLDGLRLRVYLFNPDGVFLRSFDLKKQGTAGGSIKPKGIAVDSVGHIYVVDSASNNILVFNNDGTPLLTWGRTGILVGEFWTPAGIFIDGQDRIYIADETNGRVQVFHYQK